jgi:hypothetical protein
MMMNQRQGPVMKNCAFTHFICKKKQHKCLTTTGAGQKQQQRVEQVRKQPQGEW